MHFWLARSCVQYAANSNDDLFVFRHNVLVNASCMTPELLQLFVNMPSLLGESFRHLLSIFVLWCVATCWVLIAQAWPTTTTPNTMQLVTRGWPNATQHLATNNVAICCVGMLRSLGRGLSSQWVEPIITLTYFSLQRPRVPTWEIWFSIHSLHYTDNIATQI